MSRNQHRRRDDVRAAKRVRVTDADYAAIVKRYEDAGDIANADIIRRQWEVARAGTRGRKRRGATDGAQ